MKFVDDDDDDDFTCLIFLYFVMIALSVLKIYAKMLSVGLCWRCSPKSRFWGINGRQLNLETK